ncbi:PP2C family protein-serine/threonine phosphatase [Kineococcus glutinatus]|uniref:PPM-type phosphatase domain-containing protein n=1 Tax=Kineococcus glutinatus TaxID=1070872 RepID=A0ABP9HE31_9ACTN
MHTSRHAQPRRTSQAARRSRTSDGGPRGGDFCVVVALPDGRTGVGIGDVAGHGAPVAGLMVRLRAAMRAEAAGGTAPAVLLQRLGALLGALDPDAMATAAYAVVDPATRTAVHASAGHLPFVCAAGGGAWVVQAPVGPPLGVCDDIRHEEQVTALPEGATLLACTDGLVERRGEDLDAGVQRLCRAVRDHAAADVADHVDAVFATLAPGSSDDVTLVGVRPAAPAGRWSLRLGAAPTRVGSPWQR